MMNKTMLSLLTPVIVALAWGSMVLLITIGNTQFISFIWPVLAILMAMYISGLVIWYKVEQTGYMKRIEMLEMDVNSLLGRIESVESQVRGMREE
jgi:hypothetical protein